MNLMLLTPGTGYFYCGSCLRDNFLGAALRRRGHDALLVPLYLPPVLEGPDRERDGIDKVVHMGGINMYLQQKAGWARNLPRWLANLLDRPALLRWASRRAGMTSAEDLGAMTVSMLSGDRGHQAWEVAKLVEWMVDRERPDVIVLSNVMLSGIVPRVKEALDRPVVSTLQGEAPFLDSLPEPYREQAWELLRERCADIDAFVPVSRWYGDVMRDRLGIEEARVHVVHNGIDTTRFHAVPDPLARRVPQTVGYLARMCRDKGLPTLVEAFLQLKTSRRFQGLRLRVAGAMLSEDRSLVRDLQRRIRSTGWRDHVEFLPNIQLADKLALLYGLSVLSVPATYGESFGLYLLEAMASGVPVVQPRHGAFPEILEATGGGILCEPDDPAALARSLEELLTDDARAQQLADRGRRAVLRDFAADGMAGRFERVCMMLAPRAKVPGAAESRTEEP